MIYDVNADTPYISEREDASIFIEALYWKNWKAAYMIEHFMKDTERRAAAKSFSEYWKERGYEKGESQPFWLSLLRDVL